MPIKIKERAEFQIRAYTDDYIPKVTSHHFSIADIFQRLLFRDQGESSRFSLDNSDVAQSWGRQPEFRSISNEAQFVFLGDRVYFGAEAIRAAQNAKPDSSATSGFWPRPYAFYQNCVMQPALPKEPKGNAEFARLRWKPIKGAKVGGRSRWETYKPLRWPDATFVTHTAQAPNTSIEVQTIDLLAQNQQFLLPILWRGVARGQKSAPASRVIFANGALSVKFHYQAPATVEYWLNNNWHNWKTLEGAPVPTFDNETKTDLAILRIAGRLVVGIDNHFFELLASQAALGTGTDANATYDLMDVAWAKGPLRMRHFGVSAEIGLAKLLHLAKLDEGEAQPKGSPKGYKPLEPEIERDVNRPGLTPRMDSEGNATDGTPYGWFKEGTKAEVTTEIQPGAVRYKVKLRASKDGIVAPFIDKVVARYLGLFTVDNAPFIDITMACTTGRETTAFPPHMPGAEWSLEVHRGVLARIAANWQTEYVKQFNPIEIMMRWQFTDGTYSEWVGRLHGYIHTLGLTNPAANKWMMTLQLKDSMMRLFKPHGIVDHRYYPLNYLLSFNKGAPLYGYQCVKEILAIELGEEEANRLVTYLPAFHYPLISPQTDTVGAFQHPLMQPPRGGGFFLNPPWNSAPIDWISDTFCKADHALFYYSYPTGALTGNSQVTGATIPVTGTTALATPWPSPTYGQYPEIIKNRPTWKVPDANYQSGDVNLIAFMMELTGLPEEQINRAVVYGSMPGSADLPVPSLRIAERRLPDDDPNAAIFSWARTTIKQGNHYFLPGAAEISADQTLQLYRNKKIRRWRYACRGEERMQWGDLAQAVMLNMGTGGNYSDPSFSSATLGITNEKYRIWRLQNTYNFHVSGTEQFKTSATCLPISNLGF
ncbi:MAG TPA: hypothetical protein VGB77_22200 [Abditibacteriaceae bacterium]|jgi:hypothetical protein